MEILKNGKKYTVTETKKGWKITTIQGKIEMEYKLNKNDAPAIADVEQFIEEVEK
ncbi:MAG: hypothetical protein LBP79_06060 [Clostridiales bacterium]|jgi:hypothetical protein|nr:hypothetical protein [Clostridiales bacterium]